MRVRNQLLVGIATAILAISTTGATQPDQVTDAARMHFRAGVAYLGEPTGAKYEEAYREFHAAYAETPSYKILNNIALCALFLERDGEAISNYERYLAVAPKGEIPPQKRLQIDSDLRRLKAGVVTFSLKTTPATTTVVDERLAVQTRNIRNQYSVASGELSLGLHPGTHRVTISADGYQPQVWEFEALPSSTQTRDVALVPLSERTADAPRARPATALGATQPPKHVARQVPIALYAGVAATGLFLATSVTTGVLAIAKRRELVDLNDDGLQPDKAREARKDTLKFALVSDISLGAAVLAAGATTYAYIAYRRTSDKQANAERRLQIVPAMSARHAGIDVVGTF